MNEASVRPHSRARIGLTIGILAALGLALAAPRGWAQSPATRAASTAPTGPRIEVVFDKSVRSTPYTGRVFVATTKRPGGEPKRGPNWFNPEPFFAIDVTDWRPGEPLAFDPDKALGHPVALRDLPAGKRTFQAILPLNEWSHDLWSAPGDAISPPLSVEFDPASPEPIRLNIQSKNDEPKLDGDKSVRFVKLRSKLLSAFYRKDCDVQAAIRLPGDYDDEKDRRFAALYIVSGFGGTIQDAPSYFAMYDSLMSGATADLALVYLDADCPTGHHVFADSANNGPRGRSLIEEIIPQLEREYRLIAEPKGRFVTGVSSGGWSSLWLQVAYPDTFGGTWSMSPDPVAFSAFQTIDIHDPAQNFFTMPDGADRPISRGARRFITCRGFSDMEVVLGRGGQLCSFEAVFSPRGADGQPAMLWDRKSGKLDPAVAESWRKYDIVAKLRSEWPSLGPRLRGKLHLFCGDADTFFLEAAFYKLRDALKELGSDAYVEVVPGAGHGLPPPVWRRAADQIQTAVDALK